MTAADAVQPPRLSLLGDPGAAACEGEYCFAVPPEAASESDGAAGGSAAGAVTPDR